MRDGEDDGRRDSLPPVVTDVVDDPSLDTPNCPECLTRMGIEETASGEPYWACAGCGFVAIA